MQFGVWIHNNDQLALEPQLEQAASRGFTALRCYHVEYAEQSAAAMQRAGLKLFGGMWVDAWALAEDWRSQLHFDELARYHALGVPLEAICVGNELREGGDAPDQKYFSARLATGLTNLIAAYRAWLAERGYNTPLTYAMEEIVFDEHGTFYEWVWPLIDACDIVALNSYPMDASAWFTVGAFEQSRRFLHDPPVRAQRLEQFETRLRRTLSALERMGKPLMLSETGFPSAIGYQLDGERRIVAAHDGVAYGEAMHKLVALLQRVSSDYSDRLKAIYFYEWRDNLFHAKIDNQEQSPIHAAFGLCDSQGKPKFDLQRLFAPYQHLNTLPTHLNKPT